MISTRVGPDGKKVDDSYEKKRSVEWLGTYLDRDLSKEQRALLSKVMGYQYSTTAQLGLLLEQQGYRLGKKSGNFEIIKYGAVQTRIPEHRIQQHLQAFAPWPARKKELTRLLKGISGRSEQELIHAMKKHQVDLIFHTAKDHTSPYGYTLIDHAYTQVFKGSSVLPLRVLIDGSPIREEGQRPELKGGKTMLPFPELAAGEEEGTSKKKKRKSTRPRR